LYSTFTSAAAAAVTTNIESINTPDFIKRITHLFSFLATTA
jgi:hypothetical protein